jgi:hypothetical protein
MRNVTAGGEKSVSGKANWRPAGRAPHRRKKNQTTPTASPNPTRSEDASHVLAKQAISFDLALAYP